jgi:hypothetical protein
MFNLINSSALQHQFRPAILSPELCRMLENTLYHSDTESAYFLIIDDLLLQRPTMPTKVN